MTRPTDASLTDPRCLVTTGSVIIDGANAVCRFPRTGAHRDALPGIALHVVIALTLLLMVATKRPWLRRRLLAAVMVATLGAAIPGTYALLALRADGPLHQAQTGTEITELLESVDAFASRHQHCVTVESACLACEPVLLFVSRGRMWSQGSTGSESPVPFPSVRGCTGRWARVTLAADSLERSRRTSADSLGCGTPGDGMPAGSVPDRGWK